jgi:hypothetical protein
MGKRIVPAVIVEAILAFTVAAASLAFVPETSRLWSAAVALIVLGGITPLIYAVNARIVPVFSGRTWQRPNVLFAAMLLAIGGAWLVFAGRALPNDRLEITGASAALAGGVLFMLSIVWLFRSDRISKATPPLPYPGQAAVDKVGTHFMRLASSYLLLGLLVGVVLLLWTPARGRWDLVWAHLMLVGWFMSMAAGVLYHVLPRWTDGRWKHPRLIQAHLLITLVALPAMVIALALDRTTLFAVAGSLQAIALFLMVWNIAPLAWRLPGTSRTAVIAAASFLALGVSIGASTAIDPANHVTLRLTHAQINLFGWAGLLICGVGYYLFPRLAGQPLRWPHLARAQMIVLLLGVVISATAWRWYFAGDRGVTPFITVSALMMAGSFLTFAVIVGLTFRRNARTAPNITVQPLRAVPRR